MRHNPHIFPFSIIPLILTFICSVFIYSVFIFSLLIRTIFFIYKKGLVTSPIQILFLFIPIPFFGITTALENPRDNSLQF
ncbi:hypothetical protein MsAc7_09370 [Methanolapillus millepedarum]|uniref:Uncharacterized protein n=1 Tax=Methanolapillus millepedarum TaxID=3028296 RepID=A0AA96ZW00_9EURY|nr:hypothetical protein MsAc7_09370 [Methanosarcinaceae archaeon Ac7]